MPVDRRHYRGRITVLNGQLLHSKLDALERIVPWGPGMGAWRKAPAAPWRAFRPAWSVADIEARAGQGDEAARFLLGCWPAGVRAVLVPFPRPHWPLLAAANEGGPWFVELLASNPGLGYLLAHRNAFVRETPPLVDLLRLKRREAVSLFEFPAEDLAVRVLGRIPPEHLSVGTLRDVRAALQLHGDAPRRVSHLPVVCTAAIRAATDPVVFARMPWTEITALGRLTPAEADARVERALRSVPRRAPRTLLPAPPVAPSAAINAIRTLEDLRAEGRQMHNCCASYAQRVRDGTAYFYRMTAPERATVCLRPSARGWCLEQAKGPCNRTLHPATLRAIEAWIQGIAAPRLGEPPSWAAPPAGARRRVRRRVPSAQLSFDFGAA